MAAPRLYARDGGNCRSRVGNTETAANAAAVSGTIRPILGYRQR
jgi:hypothetical protein